MKDLTLPLPNDTLERPAYTLATLFDDVIDAERVLANLRRDQQDPSTISVILREQVMLENDEINPYRTVLSEVVARSSLEAAGKWLEGLASLVLPDRAAYLSAGPIGQILSTIRETRYNVEPENIGRSLESEIRQLSQTFQVFGFERDEALYIQKRIVIGSAFIAVTSSETSVLRKVHRLLTRSMPVYVGLVHTDMAVLNRARMLLRTGPREIGTVMIADAISPLDHVANNPRLQGTVRDYRNRLVRSRYGEIIGRAEDLLFEPNANTPHSEFEHGPLSDEKLLLRYVIVRTSRRPGLSRRTLAFPGELVTLENGELVINVTYEQLVSAPRYDMGSTMSRQDEATIRRHFDAPFYWLTS